MIITRQQTNAKRWILTTLLLMQRHTDNHPRGIQRSLHHVRLGQEEGPGAGAGEASGPPPRLEPGNLHRREEGQASEGGGFEREDGNHKALLHHPAGCVLVRPFCALDEACSVARQALGRHGERKEGHMPRLHAGHSYTANELSSAAIVSSSPR